MLSVRGEVGFASKTAHPAFHHVDKGVMLNIADGADDNVFCSVISGYIIVELFSGKTANVFLRAQD